MTLTVDLSKFAIGGDAMSCLAEEFFGHEVAPTVIDGHRRHFEFEEVSFDAEYPWAHPPMPHHYPAPVLARGFMAALECFRV